MLPSAEFICLRVAIARSFGRNCALAAPGGSRNQYQFTCWGGGGRRVWYACVNPCRINRPLWWCLMLTLYKFSVFVSGRHCRCFEGKFNSFAVLFCFIVSICYQPS